MKASNWLAAVLLLLLVVISSGCVNHTTIKDAPRESISFSSPQAAQTFYDTYLSAASPKGHGSVIMYVPLPYWHRTVLTDNVRFNSAVKRADTDHDGTISDEEAFAYAGKGLCHATGQNEMALSAVR